MKVSRGQVAESRTKILAAAARLFRERGFDGVSVADIMGAAGLTHGAFYGYFASKQELIGEACAAIFQASHAAASTLTRERYIALYLSPEHRDDPGSGCAYPALAADVPRSGPGARRIMTEKLEGMITLLTEEGSARSPAQRRHAITEAAALTGALILARMVDDPALSDEILEATRVSLSRPST